MVALAAARASVASAAWRQQQPHAISKALNRFDCWNPSNLRKPLIRLNSGRKPEFRLSPQSTDSVQLLQKTGIASRPAVALGLSGLKPKNYRKPGSFAGGQTWENPAFEMRLLPAGRHDKNREKYSRNYSGQAGAGAMLIFGGRNVGRRSQMSCPDLGQFRKDAAAG